MNAALPCAQCGAEITVPDGVTKLSCGHCGARLVVSLSDGAAQLALATGLGAMEQRARLAVLERELLRLEERHEEIIAKLGKLKHGWDTTVMLALVVGLGLWWSHKLPDAWFGLGVAGLAAVGVAIEWFKGSRKSVERGELEQQREATWRAGQKLEADRAAVERGDAVEAPAVEAPAAEARIASARVATTGLVAGLTFEAIERELSLLAVQKTTLASELGSGWQVLAYRLLPPLVVAAYTAAGTHSTTMRVVGGVATAAVGALAWRALSADAAWHEQHAARVKDVADRRARAEAAWRAPPP